MIRPIRALKALSLGELVEDLLLGPAVARSEPAGSGSDESLD